MQDRPHEAVRCALGPISDRRLQETGAGVKVWEAVAWAGHKAEDLRGGIGEVKELWDEEEEEGLGEMAEDRDDGEDHAREVAVGVADEHTSGKPVVEEKGERDAKPGEEEIEGEEM